MNVSSDQEIESGNFAPRGWAVWPPSSIRVVDWNINRGLRLDSILEFLASTGVDLIILQEVDLNARRTHQRNIAREISQKLKMNYVFGREFQELTQGSRTSPAYHGQATLSRWPLSKPRMLRFHQQSNFWRPRWFLPDIEPFQERIGGRMALISEVSIGDRTLVTYNLHLESRGDDTLRYSQLEESFNDARAYEVDTPIILAGDLNMDVSRSAAAAAARQAQFQSSFTQRPVPTTPAHSLFDRGRAIDWVFTRGPVQTTYPQVHNSVSASDHYPLSVKLAFT
jgi:endonuclease/exonuclease/phosphatase family metal-dependent hydrolase